MQRDVSESKDLAADHPDLLGEMTAYAAAAHTPVREGTFSDQTRHQRDRWAKWGDSESRKP